MDVLEATIKTSAQESPPRIRAVDADVHAEMGPLDDWIGLLDESWRERVRRLGRNGK